jgi:long-chain acyl-CoA synthetase
MTHSITGAAGALRIARGRGPRAAPGTLTRLFFSAVERFDRPDALSYKDGGAFRSIGHAEVVQRVRRIALGLGALGVTRGARVAILSENRPEWALVDYACLAAGFPDVPIYPSLPAEQLPFILGDAGTSVIFVSTTAQAAKVAAIRGAVADLQWVIGFGATRDAGVDLTLAELEARGAGLDDAAAAARFRADALAIAPDAVATIMYTSGTTGEPKGVMLSHDNIASNVAAITAILPLHDGDRCLSFLPLSHIFERMAGHYLMFALGATICYAESIEALMDNFAEVQPTIVFSVPRIYEKVLTGAIETARASGGLRFALFRWARAVGARWTSARERGERPGPWLAAQYALASRLVFARIRARMGGRIRYFVSGGAPLSPDVARFFLAAGLLILEGYGLTESSPVITVNTPDRFRIGTVGTPIDGVEVAIADDGEILARGPGIMLGYYKHPDATREAIDADGWFHTGDIGELRDGYLAITDRKKDLIVTAGGKNIAPQPIENRVRQNRYVAQAVMIGDRRRYPVMLVVPNFPQLEAWATFKQIPFSDRASLIAAAPVAEKMEREVIDGLVGLANFEMPKRVVLLEHDFTVETGELTPTLKVKRRAVDARHKALIDEVYAGTDYTAEYAGVPKSKAPPTPA